MSCYLDRSIKEEIKWIFFRLPSLFIDAAQGTAAFKGLHKDCVKQKVGASERW